MKTLNSYCVLDSAKCRAIKRRRIVSFHTFTLDVKLSEDGDKLQTDKCNFGVFSVVPYEPVRVSTEYGEGNTFNKMVFCVLSKAIICAALKLCLTLLSVSF